MSKQNRRSFFKTVAGAATGAAAVVSGAVQVKANDAGGAGPHYGMLIDTGRCTGCHACSVACKSEFDVPLGVTRSWVEYVEKGTFPHVGRSFLPRLCNQCGHPQCVDVCPTGATWKREEDGIVVIDPDICIGCKYCILACPYDSRFLNPVTGAADKCDFCQHLVEKGQVPSCVNTCVGEARIFGDLNDPESEISKRMATNSTAVLRPGMGTEPNVYYIGLEHADEHDVDGTRGRHVKVTTHRKQQARS